MKTRLISLMVVSALMLGFCPGVCADSSGFIDSIIRYMQSFSAEDRQNMFTLFKPMVVNDSGIDAIVNMVRDYEPNSEGMLSDIIGTILKKTDKETAIKTLQSVKLISPDLRRRYAGYYENREVFKLSGDAVQAMRYFMDKVCNRYDGLSEIMEEDGITEGVAAKMLGILVDMNEGKPLFTDSSQSKDDFEIYFAAPSLIQKADTLSGGKGVNAIVAYLELINETLTDDEKSKLKLIGREIGFYKAAGKEVVTASGGTAYENDSFAIKYSIVKDKSNVPYVGFYGATLIEIALYKNGAKQDFGVLDKDYAVKIPVAVDNVMAYKVEDALLPVKTSVCVDGILYMRINSTGYYAVFDMPKYFYDADGWGSKYIESLYCRGIINGRAENIFAPDDSITREEFVKLVIELFGFDDEKYYANFSDVKSDEWYYKYVAIAYKNGIINGIGGNLFGTGHKITRQDICTIVANIINKKKIGLTYASAESTFKDSGNISGYAKEGVGMMHKSGIVSGDENGYFNPASFATRQEVAKIIHGILEVYVKDAQAK